MRAYKLGGYHLCIPGRLFHQEQDSIPGSQSYSAGVSFSSAFGIFSFDLAIGLEGSTFWDWPCWISLDAENN